MGKAKRSSFCVVIHIFEDHAAFIVEFIALNGETIAVETLEASQVRKIGYGEIANARPLAV